MSLDLAPEIETTVRLYAEREGVTVNELLARAFPPDKPTTPSQHLAFENPVARVSALLRQWQQEHGLPPRPDGQPHTSVQELLAQWDAEDAQLTAEEVEAERQLWEDIEQSHQEVML